MLKSVILWGGVFFFFFFFGWGVGGVGGVGGGVGMGQYMSFGSHKTSSENKIRKIISTVPVSAIFLTFALQGFAEVQTD